MVGEGTSGGSLGFGGKFELYMNGKCPPTTGAEFL